MCVDDDSYPPIPPISGGATDTVDLRLTSADGTRLMAFGARATSPTGAGMIVIPDVRGIHPYYKALAIRFAEAGVSPQVGSTGTHPPRYTSAQEGR